MMAACQRASEKSRARESAGRRRELGTQRETEMRAEDSKDSRYLSVRRDNGDDNGKDNAMVAFMIRQFIERGGASRVHEGAWRGVAWRVAYLLVRDAARPLDERSRKRTELRTRGLIDEVAVSVELLRRLEALDKDLGLVEEVEVDEDADLAQVVLRARGAAATASADDRRRLVVPDVRRARSPVDGVLQRRCGRARARERVSECATGTS